MHLLLELEKGRRSAPPGQAAFDFDSEAHPRAEAGMHDGKYRGGEFVPVKHDTGEKPLSHEGHEKPAKGGKLSYAQQVAATMKHLGTMASEWSAVGVTGTADVEDDQGNAKSMPVFDFPAGYTNAPTPIEGEGCCHLCGTNIKNYYWIQHDENKWTMPVGSECVTKFGEGKSGEHLTKEAKRAENRAFLGQALAARSALYAKYTMRGYAGYGRNTVSFGQNHTQERIYRALAKVTKDMHATDKYATGDWKTKDPQITRWVNKHGDAVRELLEEASTFLHVSKSLILLVKGRKAAPGQLGLFDEEAHPRAAAGSHDDKYRGGEFIPAHLHLTVTPDRANLQKEETLMHNGATKKPGRKDVHRPTEMVPADYSYLGMSYPVEEEGESGTTTHAEWDGTPEWEAMGRPTESTLEHAKPGQCDHCGARHTYQTILQHKPTGQIASVGHQCYENRFSVPGWEKKVAEAARKASLQLERETNVKAALAEMTDPEKEAYTWALDPEPKDYNPLAADIAQKVAKYGKLSEKQKAVLVRIHQRTIENNAKRAAENLASEECPNGKHRVSGVVLAIKVVDTQFGSTTKMLVKDARGFKVFGTRPAAYGGVEKGQAVEFDAEIERSHDDPYFGFYKRPTKMKPLEAFDEAEREWGVFQKPTTEYGMHELVARHPVRYMAEADAAFRGKDTHEFWDFPKGAANPFSKV